MVNVIGEKNSVFNEFMREIRDQDIQLDRMRFRRNMERAGSIFAYEISKHFEYKAIEVETSLGVAHTEVIYEELVLATVLRAGLPLHNGLLESLDQADSAFISAYRKYESDDSFELAFEYIASPEVEGKTVILSDPMLATGATMLLSYNAMCENGKPKHTHIVALIASRVGIENLKKNLKPEQFTIWVGAIDDELTAHAYIVPGLGDAGDLAFGEKM